MMERSPALAIRTELMENVLASPIDAMQTEIDRLTELNTDKTQELKNQRITPFPAIFGFCARDIAFGATPGLPTYNNPSNRNAYYRWNPLDEELMPDFERGVWSLYSMVSDVKDDLFKCLTIFLRGCNTLVQAVNNLPPRLVECSNILRGVERNEEFVLNPVIAPIWNRIEKQVDYFITLREIGV